MEFLGEMSYNLCFSHYWYTTLVCNQSPTRPTEPSTLLAVIVVFGWEGNHRYAWRPLAMHDASQTLCYIYTLRAERPTTRK